MSILKVAFALNSINQFWDHCCLLTYSRQSDLSRPEFATSDILKHLWFLFVVSQALIATVNFVVLYLSNSCVKCVAQQDVRDFHLMNLRKHYILERSCIHFSSTCFMELFQAGIMGSLAQILTSLMQPNGLSTALTRNQFCGEQTKVESQLVLKYH